MSTGVSRQGGLTREASSSLAVWDRVLRYSVTGTGCAGKVPHMVREGSNRCFAFQNSQQGLVLDENVHGDRTWCWGVEVLRNTTCWDESMQQHIQEMVYPRELYAAHNTWPTKSRSTRD